MARAIYSKVKREPPVILVDSREQRPLDFDDAPRRLATLETGDYSAEGLERIICIERKSVSDLYGTVGKGRERFEREIVRASKLWYFGIVIEGSLEQVLLGAPHSQMSPHSVIGSLHSWELRYPNIHVHYAGNRLLAAALVRKLLYKCAEYVERGEIKFDEKMT
jgi:ERCC4-type nuclease